MPGFERGLYLFRKKKLENTYKLILQAALKCKPRGFLPGTCGRDMLRLWCIIKWYNSFPCSFSLVHVFLYFAKNKSKHYACFAKIMIKGIPHFK